MLDLENNSDMFSHQPFETYIINLRKRHERRKHVEGEFRCREEFKYQIVDAIEYKIGAIGLWLTIKHILLDLASEKDYIIICEDDHTFTEHYRSELLIKAVEEAQEYSIDVLLGGVSWFKDALQISSDLFWVEKFTGFQFAVIFKQFYQTLLDAPFGYDDVADLTISKLSSKILVVHPFFSVQREFGYSDVTIKNADAGHVGKLFAESSDQFSRLKHVASFYQS